MQGAVNAFRDSSIRELIETLQFVMVDVGARGGIDADLCQAAWATTCIGFEPAEDECRRLNSRDPTPWKEVQFIPAAIGSSSGENILYVPLNPVGASLRRHNEALIPRYGHPELHKDEKELTVPTLTLTHALRESGVGHVDYLKLDVEGAELDIMNASEETITDVCALKVECSFLEQRIGQPLIWEVGNWLSDRGFLCAEVSDVHSWRRCPIAPHPFVAKSGMPYSRGISAQCDLVFLRDSETVDEEQTLRLALVSAFLGYYDYAITILRRTSTPRPGSGGVTAERIERSLREMSERIGRYRAREFFWKQVRSLIPASRSAFLGGISSPKRLAGS